MTRRPRRTAAAVVTAVAALVLAACSSSGDGAGTGASPSPSGSGTSGGPAFPVTVRGSAGSVTLPQVPTRVVSLSPTATETLFAVGAGSQVTAVDKNSTYPASAPRTGIDAYQLNVEAVAKYRPDLVVASDVTPAQVTQFGALKIPVLQLTAATDLQQTYDQITAIGTATAHAPQAASLVARMKQRIASIVKATPRTSASYYYELDQTFYSVTSSTFVGRLLSLLGLRSIADSAKGAAAAGGYPQLSAESVVKADPGYVLLADTKCCGQTPATVAKRPGFATLGAVRGGRVVPLDDDIASRWGPRVVDLLQTVADAVKTHPAG